VPGDRHIFAEFGHRAHDRRNVVHQRPHANAAQRRRHAIGVTV
jgi:hypothetical protein